jgi:hypothetical protein
LRAAEQFSEISLTRSAEVLVAKMAEGLESKYVYY